MYKAITLVTQKLSFFISIFGSQYFYIREICCSHYQHLVKLLWLFSPHSCGLVKTKDGPPTQFRACCWAPLALCRTSWAGRWWSRGPRRRNPFRSRKNLLPLLYFVGMWKTDLSKFRSDSYLPRCPWRCCRLSQARVILGALLLRWCFHYSYFIVNTQIS